VVEPVVLGARDLRLVENVVPVQVVFELLAQVLDAGLCGLCSHLVVMLAAAYDRPVARFALLLALALPLTASAGTTSFQFFQTPSHNIGCAYSTSSQHLRCDIRSGLKPPPPKPRGCQNDWTFGYQLSGRGPARAVCAGDTVFSPGARILRYDQTWYRGPFNCTSLRTGLYCANHTLHGFWLSRGRSYRYDGSPRAIRI